MIFQELEGLLHFENICFPAVHVLAPCDNERTLSAQESNVVPDPQSSSTLLIRVHLERSDAMVGRSLFIVEYLDMSLLSFSPSSSKLNFFFAYSKLKDKITNGR